MKTIPELNAEQFDSTLHAARTPVLVDFYAPWCGPCKLLTPLLERLAGQFEGRIQFFKVNVDDAPELAERFAISGVPTLLLINQSEVRHVIVGFPSPRVIVEKLEAIAVWDVVEVRP
jgi:thioredoxin